MNHEKKSRKLLAMLLSFSLLFSSMGITVFAQESAAPSGVEHEHNTSGWECVFEEDNRQLICELEEHTHAEDCFIMGETTAVCGQEEHIHDDMCKDEEGNIICELAEHQHDTGCWQESQPVLTCELEEHAHTDACYDIVGEWVCTPPESSNEVTGQGPDDEALQAINLPIPLSNNVIYVSQTGDGSKDGSTLENAMAISGIDSLSGDVEIKVVGEITLPENMPAANITFTGADENATVKTQNYVSFNGDTLFTDVNYNSSNFTYMFADGYDLTFTESVNATATGLKIFGGGKQKDVTGDPTITVQTSMVGADIFGGGWTGKLTGNPTINILGATLSNVYGGGYARGKSADVDGSPTINLNNCSFTGTNYIVGGGFVELSGSITADVSGTVTIKADSCVMNTSGDLYLGSRVTTSGSSATIDELNAEFTNSTLGKRVFAGSYCAGKNSNADIEKVSVQFGKVSVNGDLYAGGYTDDRNDSGEYSAAVKESAVTFTNSTAKKIFGGGYQKGADVTTSKLTVKNIEDVTIFAGGYNGYSDVSSCEINVENASSKGSGFNMVINGGGGNTPAGNLYDTATTLNFTGTNTVKTIRMVDNISIKDGAILTQLDTSNRLLSDKNLNGNLTIGTDAQLVLKGDNEISGNFSSAGNLKNNYNKLLLVGGTVTSTEGASYTSSFFSLTYNGNFPFLATKTDSVNPPAAFQSTDQNYFVANRASDEEGFETEGAPREWYLDAYTYPVTYEYEGTAPEGAPELPKSEDYTAGTQVTVAAVPTLNGYVFSGWEIKSPEGLSLQNGKFTMPSEAVTLTGTWNRTTTPIDPVAAVYKVEHYKQQEDGTYQLTDTDFPLYGEIGETVTATAKSYDRYSVNNEKSILSGEVVEPVVEDGEVKCLILKVYYDRDFHDPEPIEPVAAAYKVEHYKQQEDGTYQLTDTDFPLYDKIGATVNAVPKDYEGYSVNEGNSTMSGVVFEPVMEGGEVKYLILKVYYDKTDTPNPPDPEKKTGDLTVSKVVAGNKGETGRDFNFTVTLGDTTINGKYGDLEFTNGVAIFTLKHGESKTASDLPVNVTYEVVETEANQEGYTTVSVGTTGTITEDGAAASFTNTKNDSDPGPGPEPSEKTGNLTVSKIVTGNEGDTNRNFTFKVTLGDTSISGEYGDMTFHDGVAIFTLKHGESKTAVGLPAGIRYTVEESDNTGYTVTKSGDVGTIEADITVTAVFNNHKSGSDPAPNPDDPDKPNKPSDPEAPVNPNKPSEPTDEVPKTGDETNLALWLTLLGISGIGVIITLLGSKRKYRGKHSTR